MEDQQFAMSSTPGVGFFSWDIRDKKSKFGQKLLVNENVLKFSTTSKELPSVVDFSPISIQIEVTDRCNLSCPYCPRFADDYTIKNRDLDFEDFVQLIPQFPRLQRAHLQGLGEPFLARDFFEIVNYLKARDCYVSTTTNGIVIRGRILNAITENGIDEIEISIDGASKHTYENMRIGSDFDRLIENVEKLVSIANARGIRLKMNTVATTRNLNDLVNLPALAYRLGIREVYVDEVNLKYGIERWKVWSPTLTHPEYARGIYQQVLDSAAQLGIHLEINRPRLEQKRTSCLWPWVSTYVTCTGQVTPCCCINDYVCGDLHETPYEAIWNNHLYQDFRRALRDGPLPTQCLNCNYL